MARPPIGLVVSTFAFTLGLAGCSGVSGSGSLPGSAYVNQTIGDTADALLARRTGSQNAGTGISATNALGGRIHQFALASADDAWTGLRPDALHAPASAHACVDGIELFAPARSGEANSTEELVFYDAGCSRLAVDDVRTYTPTGIHSETIHHTTLLYAPGNSRAVSVATSTSSLSNATIGRFGLPNIIAGFANVTAAQVVVNKSPVLSTDTEFVVMPGSRSSNGFCSDSAGFDPTGIVSLDSTFGWQGGVLGGATRTVEGNGFVTWSATPSGTVFAGVIGSLSIATATQNFSCPIARPEFRLAGGNPIGTYTIPISATFHRGRLWSLSVPHATLPGGDTLSARTNHARRPESHEYIRGSVSAGRTSVATFGVNAFGNGTLTVTSTGAQYKIADWIVVQ
jgi:hypothetical protein